MSDTTPTALVGDRHVAAFQELTALCRWVGADYKKIPYRGPDALADRANTTDPTTWLTYTAARSLGHAHVGFVLVEEDPFVVLDLDHCRDPETGELEPEAKEIVRRFDTYTEVSVSGAGIHIWCKGKKPSKDCRTRAATFGIEVYDRGRFLVWTGEHLPGTPDTINARQGALDELYESYFRAQRPTPSALATVTQFAVTDEEIVRVIHRSASRGKFLSLCNGHTDAYAGDDSAADMALASILAFYTQDSGQIERLMRTTLLQRPKWDERRGSTTYLRLTVEKALSTLTATYLPPRNRQTGTGPASPPASAEARRTLRGYSDRDILTLPDPEWLIDGIVPAGALVEIVGRYGSGKTFLLIDWLMHVAGGTAWQGRRVRRGPALYLYGEGAMKPRVAAWRSFHHVEASATVGVTFVPGTVNLLDEESVATLITLIDHGELGPHPVAIALDTLSRMAPGDENSPEHGARVVAACDRIQRETGAVVIVGHHTPWDPTTQRPKGSSKIPDCADAIYLLENTDGALRLVCQKMRDAEGSAPLHLKLATIAPALVIDAGQAPATVIDKLVASLQTEGPCTKGELQARLDKSSRTVDRVIQAAGARVGIIAATGTRGCPAKYFATANPLGRGVGGGESHGCNGTPWRG